MSLPIITVLFEPTPDGWRVSLKRTDGTIDVVIRPNFDAAIEHARTKLMLDGYRTAPVPSPAGRL